jgi:hypothetical protein
MLDYFKWVCTHIKNNWWIYVISIILVGAFMYAIIDGIIFLGMLCYVIGTIFGISVGNYKNK